MIVVFFLRILFLLIIGMVAFGVIPVFFSHSFFFSLIFVCAFVFASKSSFDQLIWLGVYSLIADAVLGFRFGTHALVFLICAALFLSGVFMFSSFYQRSMVRVTLLSVVSVCLCTVFYVYAVSGNSPLLYGSFYLIWVGILSTALFPLLYWFVMWWDAVMLRYRSFRDLKKHF